AAGPAVRGQVARFGAGNADRPQVAAGRPGQRVQECGQRTVLPVDAVPVVDVLGAAVRAALVVVGDPDVVGGEHQDQLGAAGRQLVHVPVRPVEDERALGAGLAV